MGRQQAVRISSRMFGQERRFLAGNLQHRRPEWIPKTIGIARAESGTRTAGYGDDRLMAVLPARLAQRIGCCAVRWNYSKPYRRIAIEGPEAARDARRTRERPVGDWQPVGLSVINHERCVDRNNPAERGFLKP